MADIFDLLLNFDLKQRLNLSFKYYYDSQNNVNASKEQHNGTFNKDPNKDYNFDLSESELSDSFRPSYQQTQKTLMFFEIKEDLNSKTLDNFQPAKQQEKIKQSKEDDILDLSDEIEGKPQQKVQITTEFYKQNQPKKILQNQNQPKDDLFDELKEIVGGNPKPQMKQQQLGDVFDSSEFKQKT